MKLPKVLLTTLFTMVFTAANAQAIDGLLQRILPQDADRIVYCRTTFDSEKSTFKISSDRRKITVEGSDNVAIAAGINWFL